MNKIITLTAAYFASSFLGAIAGVLLSSGTSRMEDVVSFMIMCPIFQFVALWIGFQEHFSIFGFCLLIIFVGVMLISAKWYYRTGRLFAVVIFSIPPFVASLPGSALFYKAMSA